MAENDDDVSIWLKTHVLGDVCGAVAHILAQVESDPASVIIDQLDTDISSATTDETRELMFREAVKLYLSGLTGHHALNWCKEMKTTGWLVARTYLIYSSMWQASPPLSHVMSSMPPPGAPV